eukprot:15485871-Alexandrium_andersonii.AAC.3
MMPSTSSSRKSNVSASDSLSRRWRDTQRTPKCTCCCTYCRIRCSRFCDLPSLKWSGKRMAYRPGPQRVLRGSAAQKRTNSAGVAAVAVIFQ